MSTDRWRLFIAAELPPVIREGLHQSTAAARSRAERDQLPVRWVERDNLHLTLQFLGATDPALVPNLDDALRAACASHDPLHVRFSGCGAFPGTTRASVLWAGLAGDIERLASAQRDIASGMKTLGFRSEARRFHPHVTIGRVARVAPALQRRRAGELVGLIQPPSVGFEIGHAALFRSVPTGQGSRYERLAVAQFDQDDQTDRSDTHVPVRPPAGP